jgi:single-stranded DNA-binding protein
LIDALLTGQLRGAPATRTTKAGKRFATATLRATDRSSAVVFASVIAFRDSAVSALLALADGDSAAIAGELTVGTYTAKDGTVRPSLDLMAHVVLSAYHVARKRRAVAGDSAEQDHEPHASEAPAPTERAELDDDIPF